jgi:hypothetical protein
VVPCQHLPILEREKLMSGWLVIVVGVIYAGVAVMQGFKGDTPLAIVFGGYALSNIGLWMLTK